MSLDVANLARIYRETLNRLEVLSRRVQENRDVMAASEFCRWLTFSGVLSLMEAASNDERSPSPLKIDGKFLRWKTEDVLARCNERFVRNDKGVVLEESSFQTLHDKIDLVAGYLSKLSVAPSVAVAQEISDCVIAVGETKRKTNNNDMGLWPLQNTDKNQSRGECQPILTGN